MARVIREIVHVYHSVVKAINLHIKTTAWFSRSGRGYLSGAVMAKALSSRCHDVHRIRLKITFRFADEGWGEFIYAF
jgi:hypothetical protein